MGKANRAEAQLWLKTNSVPLIREVDNPDGSKKTKLRPIALLVTPLKLIESVVVDQHADHINALVQEQQVGFRVRDGREAMINAVRRRLGQNTKQVLMQGDISNAHGSINRLCVLKAIIKTRPLPGAAVCLTICERWCGCFHTRTGRSWEEDPPPLQRCEGCLARKHAEQRDL